MIQYISWNRDYLVSIVSHGVSKSSFGSGETLLKNSGFEGEPAATETEALVDAQTISKKTGMPLQTIWRACRDGSLPHFRLGRSIRFDQAEVLHLLRCESTKAPSSSAGRSPEDLGWDNVRRRLRSRMNEAGSKGESVLRHHVCCPSERVKEIEIETNHTKKSLYRQQATSTKPEKPEGPNQTSCDFRLQRREKPGRSLRPSSRL